MTKLRLVVADDFPPFLQKLVSFLKAEFDIVATAECGRSALEAIRRHRPEVAVLDLNMPGLSGIRVIEELANSSKRTPVVICSVETDADVIEAAREAGAVAYVIKSRLEKDLIPALNLAIQSQVFVSSSLLEDGLS